MMSCPIQLRNATEIMLVYQPERQTWHHNKQDNHWVGWIDQPTPERLLRPDNMDGFPVTMADGKVWGIPSLWEKQHVMEVDDNGKRVTKERWKNEALYRSTLDIVEMIRHRLLTEQADTDEAKKGLDDKHAWDDDKAFEFVCRVLPLNYRVTRFIIGKMGIIEQNRLVSLASAATDLEGLMTMQNELMSGEYAAPS